MKLTREQSYARGRKDGYLQAVADANAESKPEMLEQYFSRSDTPSRNSPTGNMMVRILAKYPGMSFDDARAKANELLANAAKTRSIAGRLSGARKNWQKTENAYGGHSASPSRHATLLITQFPAFPATRSRKIPVLTWLALIGPTETLEMALRAEMQSANSRKDNPNA